MIDLDRLAREAGISTAEYRIWPPKFSKVYTLDAQQMTAFAQLVAEEAAKICIRNGSYIHPVALQTDSSRMAVMGHQTTLEMHAMANSCAAAIRSAFGIKGPKDDPDAI